MLLRLSSADYITLKYVFKLITQKFVFGLLVWQALLNLLIVFFLCCSKAMSSHLTSLKGMLIIKSAYMLFNVWEIFTGILYETLRQ